jgi:hypothetical protein
MAWTDIAANADAVIVITEGELKAACGCKNGFATLGLGGVWSFRSKRESLALLPDFKAIAWDKRDVYICYDSDAISNPDVCTAENALARELTALGARVIICRIPPAGEAKVGMDDYITAHGATAFKSNVLATGTPFKASEELHRMNEEVVYVSNPGLVVRLDNLQRIGYRAFVDHAYANRVYHEQVGDKLVRKDTAKEWIKWPLRATVSRTTFRPGEDRFTRGQLNVWPGWNLRPKRGAIGPWVKLLDFLFAGHRDSRERRRWFEQWLAYPLQYPGTKLYSCAVLWGKPQGTGKSLVGYTMFHIYGVNATEIGDKHLHDRFNSWAENRQFVMGDEISSSRDRKRDTADRMKSLITQQELRINTKYVPEYTVPDCINYYFTSNHPDAFFMEDADRRFFVNHVTGNALPKEFYAEYDRWYRTDEGAAALFYHLLELDTTDFKPLDTAYMTDDKVEMQDAGKGSMELFVRRLETEPDEVMWMNGVEAKRDLWRTRDLIALAEVNGYEISHKNYFGTLLKNTFKQVRNGVPIHWVGDPLGTRKADRLWIIRNTEAMLKLNTTDAALHFLRERNLATPEGLTGRKPRF